MTDQKLIELLNRWGAVYRITITGTLFEAYRDELKGMTDEQLQRAADSLRKTAKFFPRPSEIWTAAKTEGWL